VPLVDASGALLGVLDIDSPIAARFDDSDARGIESLARVYVESLG
jgi:GAF domain-containing protein